MSIEIRIFTQDASIFGAEKKQIDDAMEALGFVRGDAVLTEIQQLTGDMLADAGKTLSRLTASEAAGQTAPTQTATEVGQQTRKRGEASPGKTRRTNAEIAEDKAADAAEAAGRGNIGSGNDDRPDPENPVDDAATEAADAADEAAEADASRDEAAPLTIDDVKALAVEYQEKYGFEAVQEDGAKIFVEALGSPPKDEPHWKFSIVPTDQAVLVKLAGVWRKAIDLNPLKRTAVGA